jgi:hypothetical protein
MSHITPEILARSILAVRDMDLRQREQLASEIYASQPQLLASVLALRRFGVSLEQLEVPLNILLVCYQAMKTTGHPWPVISETLQEQCIQRVAGRIRFIEGLAPEQVTQSVSTFVAEHKEPYLLAFVFGELGAQSLMRIETEAQKFLVLGALNLVECMAEAG